MQVDFLGHASILVRGEGGAILFDPLFEGVHQDGVYDVFPTRTLDLENLPEVDLVVVSHIHQDHFDLDALDLLPREMPLVVPQDQVMVDSLRAMGFQEIHAVQAMDEIQAGTLTLVPTPAAEGGVIEHGFLVIEGEQILWNLVDTVPEIDGVAEVKARYPEIDVAIVPWMPLCDADFQVGNPVRFPYSMYDVLMSNVLQVDARYIIPGSCGFQATEGYKWTNSIIFPQTRQRFVQDALRANPEWTDHILIADPGDTLELLGGKARVMQGAMDYITAEPWDWEVLEWRPDLLGFPVVEENPAFSLETAEGAVEAFFLGALQRHLDEQDARYAMYHRWEVIQIFEVIFHDGVRHFTLDFTGAHTRVEPVKSPLALKRTTIKASALLGLVAGWISWEFVLMGGAYRHHDHTYRVDAGGLHMPGHHGIRLEDPLCRYISRDEALSRKLQRDLERLMPEEAPAESDGTEDIVVESEPVADEDSLTIGVKPSPTDPVG